MIIIVGGLRGSYRYSAVGQVIIRGRCGEVDCDVFFNFGFECGKKTKNMFSNNQKL